MNKYEVEVDSNGTKYWYLNDMLHREDGAAIEHANGDKFFYLNNKLHREDGPAIERANGDKFWYLNDKYLTEQEFNQKMNKPTELTMSQLNDLLGYDVKIVG